MAVFIIYTYCKKDNFPKSHRGFDIVGEKSPAAQFVGRDSVVLSNGEVWKK